MTDEELKQEVARADRAAFEAMAESIVADANAARLQAEVDRLRAENRKLVEACKAALHDLEAFATVVKPYTQAPVLAQLRAAIEGK